MLLHLYALSINPIPMYSGPQPEWQDDPSHNLFKISCILDDDLVSSRLDVVYHGYDEPIALWSIGSAWAEGRFLYKAVLTRYAKFRFPSGIVVACDGVKTVVQFFTGCCIRSEAIDECISSCEGIVSQCRRFSVLDCLTFLSEKPLINSRELCRHF